jgi:hypothetical protein
MRRLNGDDNELSLANLSSGPKGTVCAWRIQGGSPQIRSRRPGALACGCSIHHYESCTHSVQCRGNPEKIGIRFTKVAISSLE